MKKCLTMFVTLVASLFVVSALTVSPVIAGNNSVKVTGGAGQWSDLNMDWNWNHTQGTPNYTVRGDKTYTFGGFQTSEGSYMAKGNYFALGSTKVDGGIIGNVNYSGDSINGWVAGGNFSRATAIGNKRTRTSVSGSGTVFLDMTLNGDTGGYSSGQAEWSYKRSNRSNCFSRTSGGGGGISFGSVTRDVGANYSHSHAVNTSIAVSSPPSSLLK